MLSQHLQRQQQNQQQNQQNQQNEQQQQMQQSVFASDIYPKENTPDEITPTSILFFPPLKKKQDNKKKKKLLNEKVTKQQLQFLFSKTPELQLHMPTGSQLTRGGILGGELTERKVTTVEPSKTVEEGVKINTRSYDRIRGKRSNDYRGISRTNLAIA